MDENLQNLARKYFVKTSHKESRKQSPFTRCWCWYDFWSVLFHLIAVFFFTVIPIALAIFDEILFGAYQNTEYHHKMQIEDLTIAPWHLPLKLPILADWNIALIGFSISFVIFSVIELIIYYRYIQFPLDTLSHFKQSKEI